MIVWDRSEECLYLYRDLVGTRPLYRRWKGQSLHLASECRSLLDPGEAEGTLDQSYLDDWVANRPTGERTPFRAVRRVYPGVIWRSRAAGPCLADPELVAAWAIKEGPRRWNEEDAASCVREALRLAVRRRLQPGVETVVSLSGGLDSGSVWTLASREAQSGPGRLSAISVRFPGYRCDEERVLAIHREQAGKAFHQVDGTLAASNEKVLDTTSAVDIPTAQSAVFLKQVFDEAKHRGAQVVLTGLGGDQWFGGNGTFFAELIAAGRFLACGRLAARLTSRGLLRPKTVAGSCLRGFRSPAQSRRRRDKTAMNDAASTDASQFPFADRLEVERSGWYMETAEQLAEAAGLEVRHPFMDQDLIELVLPMPGYLHWTGSAPKGLLRRAMETVADARFLGESRKVGLDSELERRLCEPERTAAEPASARLWVNAIERFRETIPARATESAEITSSRVISYR